MTAHDDSSLSFRFATPDDIPMLVALVTRAYRGDASRVGWTTEADLLDGGRISPEVLAEDLRRPGSRVLVAEQHGQAVACAHVAPEGDAAYFGMFAVNPQLQGRGVGDRLLLEAERIAREELGQATMRMTVIDLRAELIDWYLRRGYRRTGITKPFPYGDTRFGIPRRDDLRFEVLEKTL
ncbi:GNAT family N-acetyltransferase [Alkalisalibacterium limincola]|uniref:GNAT family N-acetyltransferase n=1 Tax=Alkalisalibacterium limincola TaxID=2699169 RepID=A0A5C8KUX7_9GAMM|nr:GNAT family N-acetyltransferase [Alkalisalibacterium limincola]TXK65091.1 GNAT family N-acetyltransferase [Alkalisalibacterium limincola]